MPVIMIVDDEPINISILANIFESSYDIKVATSGARCLSLIESGVTPDLILVDIMMPDLSGYEVLELLKADPTTMNIPVIFVSSNDTQADVAKGIKLGASDYITKPVFPAVAIARVSMHLRLKQQSDELRKMALFDQLTNLYNRHYLIEAGTQRLSESYRNNSALALIMLDIDNFKHLNDVHGHDFGDKILQQVSKTISKDCRSIDIVSRYGGEEFFILLPGCGFEEAMSKAESLRVAIEENAMHAIRVTASFGVCAKNDTVETLASLIKRADINLYKAKNNGRNCVFGA
jgi:diguanylate cyclase (GGDEF)-like protein